MVIDRQHSFPNTAFRGRQQSFLRKAVVHRQQSFRSMAVMHRQHSFISDLQGFKYMYRNVIVIGPGQISQPFFAQVVDVGRH